MQLSSFSKQFIRSSNLIPLLYTSQFCSHINTLEHVYPRCFTDQNIHNRDIHNIFATTYTMNSLRSNFTFDILDPKSQDVINLDNTLISRNKKIIYPSISDRGVIARAVLYMQSTYNYSDFGNYSLYSEWNDKCKPRIKECIHNEFAYVIQGTRNPHIDKHYKNDKKYIETSIMIKKEILRLLENKDLKPCYTHWEKILDQIFEEEKIQEELRCPKCNKLYLRKSFYDKHVAKCIEQK